MHKLLQQAKQLLAKDRLFVIVLLFIFSIPLYAGQIITTAPAQIFTPYVNYLHVRITLHLLLNIVLFFYSYQVVESRKFTTRILYFFALSTFLSLYPIYVLSMQHSLPFWLLAGTSTFHLAEFLLQVTAFIFVIDYLLKMTTSWKKESLVYCILGSSFIQSVFVLGQSITRGPILPTWLSWTGQPPEFTSQALVGIFEYFRTYGTTPHPNILAAIAVLYLCILLFMKVKRKIVIGISILLFFIVLTTMSKIGIGAFALICCIFLLRRHLVPIKFAMPMAPILLLLANASIVIVMAIIYHFHTPIPYLESRAVIQQLYSELLEIHPFILTTGTGFVMAIPYLLASTASLPTSLFWYSRILAEPPHNALLLMLTEFGLPTMLLLLLILWGQVKTWETKLSPWQIITLTLVILAFGGLDHFLVY